MPKSATIFKYIKLKKVTQLLCIVVSFLIFSCSSKSEKTEINTQIVSNSAGANGNTGNNADIKFEEEEFDFGKISQGEKVSHSFIFKNVGAKALVISSAKGSCGCTVPEWPKEPVAPNATGKIDVVFNSEGKSGYQEKTITIVTNCEPATRIIRIKTEIVVPETAK
ncbi:MAG: DUF1573 domain-containing protein [Bacteroidetes bacterium]|nr:DUF1573 domain-containing protein [Bacteroidota bacterium]